MKIKSYEFKKVVTSPVIIGLVIVAVCFNFFTIYENTYFNDELLVLNKIVNKFGYKIGDNMLHKFEKYYDNELYKLNKITNKKTSKTYNSVSDFFEEQYSSCSNYDENIYSKEEVNFINQLGIIEQYYYMIENIDDVYEKIDPMEIAESEIIKYRLSGKAADIVRNEYRSFAKRFNQLVENEEHKNLFFMCCRYKMHSLLFRTLFGSFIFEITMLVVLITAYLINFEFDNNTQLLAYSTKRGRKLIVDKLAVSIIVNMLVVTIILVTGLSAYFIVFDYTGLWNVPISSYFNTEYNVPYMSWWNMSFIQYLLCGIGLIYVCALLFTGITFIMTKFTKNGYIVFFTFLIISGMALLMPSVFSKQGIGIFIAGFTPFTLVLNPHYWFMESSAFTTFKYYELITVGVWFVLLLIFSSICIRRFKKQDIY